MESNLNNFKIETAYNNISVIQQHDRLELRSNDNALQSVIDLTNPHRLALKNLEYLIAILLFIPEPRRVLILGTAAGSLLHFLRHHYPAEITTVDIDAELVEKLLSLEVLPPPDSKLSYVYDDAQHYIAHCQQKFDLILVDIFDGAQSPRWLLDKNNIEALYRLLDKNAALAFNLLIDSDHDFTRFYRDLRLVCDRQTLCTPVEGFENTIAYGFREQLPERELSWYMERTLELSNQHAIDYLQLLSVIYTTNPSGNGVI